MPTHRFACALLLIGSAVGLCPVRAADDAAAAREKLSKAKEEYEAEVQKFQKAVTDLLDKREDAARKAGDKKAVDAAKTQRKAFDDAGDLPPGLPAAVSGTMKAAATKFDRALGEAVKEFVRLKDDDAAAAVEKDQHRFFADAAFRFGKRTYLSALKPSDVKVWQDSFSTDGTFYGQKLKKDGEPVSHSIFTHPPAEKSVASAKYTLAGKYAALRASVGVPTLPDTTKGPASELTFEVLGDGKSLWKSEPVSKLDSYQECRVRVEKVKVLTLLVHCPGSMHSARAVWIEPVLVE